MISFGRTRFNRYSGSLSLKLVVVFVALFFVCLTVVVRSRQTLELKTEPILASVQPSPDTPLESRKVFPLSVIHGGAYSRQELERARKTDAVVAAHYGDFGASPKFQKLSHDVLMYVSYRRSNRVYWSKVRHRIPQGETVISDGNCLARARCGNRLSATPQGPVAPKEPTEEVLNTPDIPDAPVSYKLAELPGPAGRPFGFFLPGGFDGGAPVAASPTPVSAPGGMASNALGSPFVGAPSGFGGSGPFAVTGGTRQPATLTGVTSLLSTSTTGGNTLPTSPGFPGSGPVPIIVPGSPVVELVPEPGTLGYLFLASFLIGIRLTRSSNRGFLRGQIG